MSELITNVKRYGKWILFFIIIIISGLILVIYYTPIEYFYSISYLILCYYVLNRSLLYSIREYARQKSIVESIENNRQFIDFLIEYGTLEEMREEDIKLILDFYKLDRLNEKND